MQSYLQVYGVPKNYVRTYVAKKILMCTERNYITQILQNLSFFDWLLFDRKIHTIDMLLLLLLFLLDQFKNFAWK